MSDKNFKSRITKTAKDKVRDTASNEIDKRLESSETVQKARKAQKAIETARRVSQKAISSARSLLGGLISLLSNPITWFVAAVVVIIIVLSGMLKTIGKNDFAQDCGDLSAPEFSLATIEDENSRAATIMGHFKSIGMNPKEASVLSAVIMSESNGDPKAGGIEDCDNECALNSNHSNVGLLSFTRAQVKELAQFAIDNDTDWRYSSTQLRYISNKMENLSPTDAKKFASAPGVQMLKEVTDFNFTPDKALDSKANQIQSSHNGEGEFCKAIGDGTGKNKWAINSGQGSFNFGSGNLAAVVQMAWDYSTYEVVESHGKLKSHRTKPELEAALDLAYSFKPDPGGRITASCDRGVATAFIATQTDPNFPWGSTREQQPYMEASPLYERVTCEAREPGDIIIWWNRGGVNHGRINHITLFAGDVLGDGQEWMIEASYEDYEPTKRKFGGPNLNCNNMRSASTLRPPEWWRCVGCQ